MKEQIAVLYCNSTEVKNGKTSFHNKIYIVYLHEVKGGWVTDFAYGPRGKSFKAGTKTKSPTSYYNAAGVFNGLVREKTDRGRGANQYTDVSSRSDNFVSDAQIKRAFGSGVSRGVAANQTKQVNVTLAKTAMPSGTGLKQPRGKVQSQKQPQPQAVERVEIEVRLERESSRLSDLPIELQFVWEERLER